MNMVRLTGADIDGNLVSCTLAQIIAIFELLSAHDLDQRLHWCAADVDPAPGSFAPYAAQTLAPIGSTDDVLEFLRASTLAQLDFAVFVALPDASAGCPRDEVSAEGPSRKQVGGSEIEVVAFDDTYIEVITDRADVLDGLSARFGLATVQP